jgi:hypothetical protein
LADKESDMRIGAMILAAALLLSGCAADYVAVDGGPHTTVIRSGSELPR